MHNSVDDDEREEEQHECAKDPRVEHDLYDPDGKKGADPFKQSIHDIITI